MQVHSALLLKKPSRTTVGSAVARTSSNVLKSVAIAFRISIIAKLSNVPHCPESARVTGLNVLFFVRNQAKSKNSKLDLLAANARTRTRREG